VGGLRARGGFEIADMSWEKGRFQLVRIKSTLGGNCRVRTYLPLEMNSGKLKVAAGNNPNSFFRLEPLKRPFISDKARLTPFVLPKTELYDFDTKAGREYLLAIVQQVK
jgi:alpha-L-fucosidase 2